MPAMAALAALLMIAAAAAGLDEMANIRVPSPALVTIPVAAADAQPPVRHLILRSLAEGSLPGGFPYDEPREEKYDEDYQEALRIESANPA